MMQCLATLVKVTQQDADVLRGIERMLCHVRNNAGRVAGLTRMHFVLID